MHRNRRAQPSTINCNASGQGRSGSSLRVGSIPGKNICIGKRQLATCICVHRLDRSSVYSYRDEPNRRHVIFMPMQTYSYCRIARGAPVISHESRFKRLVGGKKKVANAKMVAQ